MGILPWSFHWFSQSTSICLVPLYARTRSGGSTSKGVGGGTGLWLSQGGTGGHSCVLTACLCHSLLAHTCVKVSLGPSAWELTGFCTHATAQVWSAFSQAWNSGVWETRGLPSQYLQLCQVSWRPVNKVSPSGVLSGDLEFWNVLSLTLSSYHWGNRP